MKEYRNKNFEECQKLSEINIKMYHKLYQLFLEGKNKTNEYNIIVDLLKDYTQKELSFYQFLSDQEVQNLYDIFQKEDSDELTVKRIMERLSFFKREDVLLMSFDFLQGQMRIQKSSELGDLELTKQLEEEKKRRLNNEKIVDQVMLVELWKWLEENLPKDPESYKCYVECLNYFYVKSSDFCNETLFLEADGDPSFFVRHCQALLTLSFLDIQEDVSSCLFSKLICYIHDYLEIKHFASSSEQVLKCCEISSLANLLDEGTLGMILEYLALIFQEIFPESQKRYEELFSLLEKCKNKKNSEDYSLRRDFKEE